jgi:hypothetical protein
MKPEELTVKAVEKAIRMPVRNWHGNCYAIACQIIKKKLVKGRAIYGHYKGPVAHTGYWKDQRDRPFQRHGWIKLADDRILDPTRWSFEDKEPYITIIEETTFDWCDRCDHVKDEHETGNFFNHCSICNCDDFVARKDLYDEYDEGGSEFRTMLHPSQPPVYDANAKKVRLYIKSQKVRTFVRNLLGRLPDITIDQLFWLSNRPIHQLEPHTATIYKAIVAIGEEKFIPIDYRKAVSS